MIKKEGSPAAFKKITLCKCNFFNVGWIQLIPLPTFISVPQ